MVTKPEVVPSGLKSGFGCLLDSFAALDDPAFRNPHGVIRE